MVTCSEYLLSVITFSLCRIVLFRIFLCDVAEMIFKLLHITLRIRNTHHVNVSVLTEIDTAAIVGRELGMSIVQCSGHYEVHECSLRFLSRKKKLSREEALEASGAVRC